MRRLTSSELRLALLFGTAVFIALNLFAMRAWMQHRSGILFKTDATRTALQEAHVWIEGAEAIGPAREWIVSNPPPTDTAEQASTSLLTVVRSAADASGLKVVEENLLPAPSISTGFAAALQTKVTGPFAGATKFLFSVQDPKAWRAITKIVVRSEAEPPNVVVDMEIRQYYLPAAMAQPSDVP